MWLTVYTITYKYTCVCSECSCRSTVLPTYQHDLVVFSSGALVAQFAVSGKLWLRASQGKRFGIFKLDRHRILRLCYFSNSHFQCFLVNMWSSSQHRGGGILRKVFLVSLSDHFFPCTRIWKIYRMCLSCRKENSQSPDQTGSKTPNVELVIYWVYRMQCWWIFVFTLCDRTSQN